LTPTTGGTQTRRITDGGGDGSQDVVGDGVRATVGEGDDDAGSTQWPLLAT
jgi:hypothetical protein